jgi:hypothetical protein
MIDTTRTITIEGSTEKLVSLTLVGVLLTAGAGALAFGLVPEDALFARLLGLTGLVVFALCTLVAAWQLLSQSGPVITMSPQGIRDTRIAAETIPWSAVTNVSTLKYRYSRSVGLSIDATIEARLTFSRIVRCTRPINLAFGEEELPISASGMKTDFEMLMASTMAYWQAWRGRQTHPHRASSDPGPPIAPR